MLRFIFILLIICNSLVFSKKNDNPNWVRGVYYKKIPSISDFIFAPTKIDFETYSNFYIKNDLSDEVFNYEISTTVLLSRLFNFNIAFKHTKEILLPDIICVSWILNPIYFFSLTVDYRFRDFSEYRIFDHNFIIILDFYIDLLKWFDIHIKSGFNLQFIDLDIEDFSYLYKKDWFFQFIFLYELSISVHPIRFISFKIKFGNYDNYEINSMNYWRLENRIDLYFIKNISFSLFTGFSTAGGFPFAGYINRGWIGFGVDYALKF